MDAGAQYLGKPWLKFYEPGVPETVDPPLKSVPQAFDEATERAPARPGWPGATTCSPRGGSSRAGPRPSCGPTRRCGRGTWGCSSPSSNEEGCRAERDGVVN